MKVVTSTTVSRPVIISYTCSKCGKKLSRQQRIDSSFSQTSVPRKSDSAKTNTLSVAQKQLDEKVENLIEATRRDPVEALRICKFNVSCECGHKEPWSRLYYAKYIYPILPIYFLVLLLTFDSTSSANDCLIAIGVGVFGLAIYMAYRLIMDKLIKDLPEQSLPELFFIYNEKEVTLHLRQIVTTPPLTATPSISKTITTPTVQKRASQGSPTAKKLQFCPYCGEKLGEMHRYRFCGYCGEKINH